MNCTFCGTVVPLVTPYKPDLTLDLDGFAALLRYFDAQDAVDGLFVMGATGEYDRLNDEERCQILDLLLELKLKTAWIPNISSLEWEPSLALARCAVERGIETAGFILPTACRSFADVRRCLIELRDMGLKVFVYQTGNSPYPLAPEELGELVDADLLTGIKDSCSNSNMFRHLRYVAEQGERITVIQGVEMLYLSSLCLGGAGVIGGGCNVYPEQLTAIRQAWESGDLERARQIQRDVNVWIEGIYDEGSGLESMKYYLALSGVPIGTASRSSSGELSAAKRGWVEALHRRLLG